LKNITFFNTQQNNYFSKKLIKRLKLVKKIKFNEVKLLQYFKKIGLPTIKRRNIGW